MKMQALLLKIRQKACSSLCLSAGHSVLHLLFYVGSLRADPHGGLAPTVQLGTGLCAQHLTLPTPRSLGRSAEAGWRAEQGAGWPAKNLTGGMGR